MPARAACPSEAREPDRPAQIAGALRAGVRLRIIPPAGYLDFIALQASARLVLTDSGGVQEETTALGVPCLTLRENTERPITLTHGTNQLVGTDPGQIVAAAKLALAAPACAAPAGAVGRPRRRADRGRAADDGAGSGRTARSVRPSAAGHAPAGASRNQPRRTRPPSARGREPDCGIGPESSAAWAMMR